jgi:hypothetical protein
VDELAKRLDGYPNFAVDTAGRVSQTLCCNREQKYAPSSSDIKMVFCMGLTWG